MTKAELTAFLQRGINCRLACLDEEGHPYVVPVWFEHADGGFYVIPRARSTFRFLLTLDERVPARLPFHSARLQSA